jgi:hypothetical protein
VKADFYKGRKEMLFLSVLFILFIIALAFYLNARLDRREEKRLGRDVKGRGGRP